MKQLKIKIITSLLALSTIQSFAQSTYGAIKGLITNKEGEPVFGATIKITQGGSLIGGTQTDGKGKYTYKPLNPGVYEVLVFGMDFSTQSVTGVSIKPEKTAYVDMKVSMNEIDGFTITAIYKSPIVDNSYITMKSIDSEDLMHMAINRTDIKGVVANISSEATEDPSGDLHVRGGRAESTALIVDGVRTPNLTGISMLAVDNLSFITGGVPAQYGDAVSGIIIVTTKDYFSGIRTKHLAENAYNEKQAKIKREKQAKLDEEKRKKEIELELELEKTHN